MPAPFQETQARRYRIEKYLTEGGMGAIYIGKKLGPGGFAKEVVLKQLLPEYTARPEFRDLFFREAKISATLDHANIVHTFDLVESDQSLFIVMEYVRGADLRTIIRRARQRKRELSSAAAIYIALGDPGGSGICPHPTRFDRQVAGHYSPGRLAVEHHLLGARRREVVGLWNREGVHVFVGVLPGARQGRLHVARTGAQPSHRSPVRPVFVVGLPLRITQR